MGSGISRRHARDRGFDVNRVAGGKGVTNSYHAPGWREQFRNMLTFRPHGSDMWLIEPAPVSHSIEFWDQQHGSKVSFRAIIDSTIPSPEISEEGPELAIRAPPIRITLAPRAPLLPTPSSQ